MRSILGWSVLLDPQAAFGQPDGFHEGLVVLAEDAEDDERALAGLDAHHPHRGFIFRDGFEAIAEDDSPMRMMCIELKKDILVILVVLAKDDDTLVEAVQLAERGLRLK